MARHRNEETIASAQAAAQAIMLEAGYEAASYTAIAERSSIARTTVQHYFPRKEEFATSLMTRIAAIAQERARTIAPEGESLLAVYYLTVQISYGVFYLTEGTRRFLFDLTVSRDLQHAAAPDYIKGAMEVLPLGAISDRDLFDLQFAIGGIYEMHYLFLTRGETPELAALGKHFVRVLARVLEMGQQEYDRMIELYTLTNDELFAIGAELLEEI